MNWQEPTFTTHNIYLPYKDCLLLLSIRNSKNLPFFVTLPFKLFFFLFVCFCTMAFTIKELESLSGIKAHTIRIWEQRYHFLKPDRSATNIRTYNNEELKTLLTVALLNKYGYKISRIDEMPEQQRAEALLHLQVPEAVNERKVNELIAYTIDLKSVELEHLLHRHIQEKGLEEAINLIFQFLEKLGLLWQSNRINPAQEHIVSNIIRQKLISAIDRTPTPAQRQATALLFLPEDEHHELGLLFVYYLLRKKGIATIYLGASVPVKDLEYIVQAKKPQFLYTHLTSFPRQLQFEKFLRQLSGLSPAPKILISGAIVSSYSGSFATHIHPLKSLQAVSSYISTL